MTTKKENKKKMMQRDKNKGKGGSARKTNT